MIPGGCALNELMLSLALLLLLAALALVLEFAVHGQAGTVLRMWSILEQASIAALPRLLQVIFHGASPFFASLFHVRLRTAFSRLVPILFVSMLFLIYTTQKWILIIGHSTSI
jgi:hypothetical protein